MPGLSLNRRIRGMGHGDEGLLSKAALEKARIRIGQASQETGTRKSEEIIPNRVIQRMRLYRESFFTNFGVSGKGAVRESVFSNLTFLFKGIHDASRTEGPEPQVLYQHRDIRSLLKRSVGPAQFDPRKIKHFPPHKKLPSARFDLLTVAESDSIVVDGVACGSGMSGSTHF